MAIDIQSNTKTDVNAVWFGKVLGRSVHDTKPQEARIKGPLHSRKEML